MTRRRAAEIDLPSLSVHPAEARLLLFQSAHTALTAAERQQVAQHLSRCAPCRTELKLLQTFDFSRLKPRSSKPPQEGTA